MTDYTIQKRLAAQIMKCSPKKVMFDVESLAEIKESITKADLRTLIARGVITKRTGTFSSRVRARVDLIQKKKGLRKGLGSRKGTANSRSNPKLEWMNRIRKQRELLKILKNKKLISIATFRTISNKAKGGYFRSERHLKLYLNENKLFTEKSV